MSYDVWLEIDTGGEHPHSLTECYSPTYNLGPMFRLALSGDEQGEGVPDWNGMFASELISKLREAIAAMEDDPAKFKRLNPENGWGNYEGALNFLSEILRQCIQHPKATVRA